MKLTNTLKYACNYFRKELQDVYAFSELNQILQITFYHYFKLNKADLILNKEEEFSVENFKKIVETIKVLKTKKPLAQIIGEWEFYGLVFKVNEHTLIPRSETEELIQLIVAENNYTDNFNILDIGTGTGCIAIALKNEFNLANVTAFDVSEEALKVALKNAIINEQEIVFKKVDILNFEDYKIDNKYDIIVSNPPYIPEKEKELMHKNVLDYEPKLALFVADKTPLIFYEMIASFALKHLKYNGKIYVEINENYGLETKQLLIDKNFKNVTIIKDINGKDRIVKAIL